MEAIDPNKLDNMEPKTLSVLTECLQLIREAYGIEVDLDHIPLDDEVTLRIFQAGDTADVCQFHFSGMRKFLQMLTPHDFSELVALYAMYRPGSMDFIGHYIQRKHGVEPISYELSIMEKYLKETYGLTLYPQQIISIAQEIASYTVEESEDFCKVVCSHQLSQRLFDLHEQFVNRGGENGYDTDSLERVWHQWECYGRFTYDKAHAARCARLAFQAAYLKVHFPNQYRLAYEQ